jgi:hypothetical protein
MSLPRESEFPPADIQEALTPDEIQEIVFLEVLEEIRELMEKLPLQEHEAWYDDQVELCMKRHRELIQMMPQKWWYDVAMCPRKDVLKLYGL